MTDLGVPFDQLKETLFEEFQEDLDQQKQEIPLTQEEKLERNRNLSKITEDTVIIVSALFSIPIQLSLGLTYNTMAGVNEIAASVFTTVKDSACVIAPKFSHSKYCCHLHFHG